MAGTRNTEIPDPPEWVKEAGAEAVWAWGEGPSWRYEAERATEDSAREILLSQARDAYWKAYWLI